MKQLFSLFLFLILIPIIVFSQYNNGSISGEVRDAVTKQPLPGTNVVISGTSFGAASDDKGYYVIKNVAPGKYSVKASIIGYESSTNADVVVSPQRNKKISFELNTSAIEMNEVSIQSDYFARPAENVVSMRTLSPEEIRRSPGSAEDIFRVMQSMPGVATAGGKSAQLIVRGGSPDENLTLLDNIEIYNPIHFARTG